MFNDTKDIINVTFISTVYNEADNIDYFIDSIFSQTVLPSEIIIVDSDSNDGTFEKLESWKNKFISVNVSYKIISEKCSISKGRNIAIGASKNQIICVSDAGCTIDPNWLVEITRPFYCNDQCEAVSGNFTIIGSGYIQRSFRLVGYRNKKKHNPSSRSFAFKKSCWEKYPYPENLIVHEDTKLCNEWRVRGIRFCFSERAIVSWIAERKLQGIYRKYRNYSFWWAKSGDRVDTMRLLQIYSYIIPVALVAFSPLFAITIIIASLSTRVIRQLVRSIQFDNAEIIESLLYIPGMYAVQMTLDFSTIAGIISGKLSRLSR